MMRINTDLFELKMECRWIEDIKEFKEIAREWDETLLASKEDNPFLLSEFIVTWWKYYGHNLKLQIFVLYQNGKIIGGLPLCSKKKGHLEYPGGWTANYTEFLSLGDRTIVWDKFLEAIQQKNDWRLIQLNRLRKSRLNNGLEPGPNKLKNIKRQAAATKWSYRSGGLTENSSQKKKLLQCNSIKRQAAATKWSYRSGEQTEKTCQKNKFLQNNNIIVDVNKSDNTFLTNIPDDFSGYIDSLPQKLRYYIRRSENEFSKLGGISLCSLNEIKKINTVFDRFVEFSKISFKRRKQESAFEDKNYCNFFKELLNKLFLAGYLDANVLMLDKRIVAIHFGYSIRNNLNYVLTTYDSELAPLNPGHLLIYKLIELGSKRKKELFDMYTGYHLYKKQWSTQTEETLSIEIRPNTLRSKIENMAMKQLKSSKIVFMLKNKIRSYPRLMNTFRNIKKSVK